MGLLGLVALMFGAIVLLALLAITRANNVVSEQDDNRLMAIVNQEVDLWSTNDMLTGRITNRLSAGIEVAVVDGPDVGSVSETAVEEWYQIEINDIRGWVLARFIDLGF